jgi:membrane protease YdiL (CAAX protease family)
VNRTDLMLLGVSAPTSAAVLYLLWRTNVIRPESFPTSPKQQRDVWGVPTPVWLLCAAVLYLTQIEAAMLTSQLGPGLIGTKDSVQRQSIVQAVAAAAGIAVGVVMIYLLRPRTQEKTGLVVRSSHVAPGLTASLMMAPICILLLVLSRQVALLFGVPDDPVAHTTLKQIIANRDTIWGWLLVASAVIGAPILEEIMYRALLQSCLVSMLGQTWPAIIGTSALFASMHATVVPAHALPVLFALGMMFGIAYERTRMLGVPIIMHVMFNAANIVVAVVSQTGNGK